MLERQTIPLIFLTRKINAMDKKRNRQTVHKTEHKNLKTMEYESHRKKGGDLSCSGNVTLLQLQKLLKYAVKDK